MDIRTLFGLVLLLVLCVLLVRIFYWRIPEGFAYVRTSNGGEELFFHGGFFAFPGVHRILAIDMRGYTTRTTLSRADGLLSADRVSIEVDVLVRVNIKPDESSVRTARMAFDCKLERLGPLLESRCKAALQLIASNRTADILLNNRIDIELAVEAMLGRELAWSGLEVALVSLTNLGSAQPVEASVRGTDVEAISASQGAVRHLKPVPDHYLESVTA